MKISQIISESMLPVRKGSYQISGSSGDNYRVTELACDGTNERLPEGLPEFIGGRLDAGDMAITTLKGAPKTVMFANFKRNSLTTLEGSLESCTTLNVEQNLLHTLSGNVTHINNLKASYNSIKSLKDIHKSIKSCLTIALDGNPIESNILGLLLIKNLKDVRLTSFDDDLSLAERTIRKYLPNTRGMEAVFECQEELIELGLEKFAEL